MTFDPLAASPDVEDPQPPSAMPSTQAAAATANTLLFLTFIMFPFIILITGRYRFPVPAPPSKYTLNQEETPISVTGM